LTTELQSSEAIAEVQASTALDDDFEIALQLAPLQQVGTSSAMHCESVLTTPQPLMARVQNALARVSH
jgi:hypothetical protein